MTDWDRVRRLTFVPFVHDGRCALIPVGRCLVLPSGEVLPGEDPLLDTCLRVPLETAGFRRQSLHELEADGDHLSVWCEGDDGCLLVSNYVPAEQRDRHPAVVLDRLGFRVAGVTAPGTAAGARCPQPRGCGRAEPSLDQGEHRVESCLAVPCEREKGG
jgi:hypothetical protein